MINNLALFCFLYAEDFPNCKMADLISNLNLLFRNEK